MKIIKTLLLGLTLAFSHSMYSQTKFVENLDKLTKEKREAYLQSLAREVIGNIAPGYFLSEGNVEITEPVKYVFSAPGTIKDQGRYYYTIRQSYDKSKIMFERPWSFELNIWVDTGEPESIMLGNGMGIIFHGDDTTYSDVLKKGRKIKFQYFVIEGDKVKHYY